MGPPAPEYNTRLANRRKFYEAIRSYWPGRTEELLNRGYPGARPGLGTLDAFADGFVIQSQDVHGASGLISLFGIGSHGLTSCLAIADKVVARLGMDELKEEE